MQKKSTRKGTLVTRWFFVTDKTKGKEKIGKILYCNSIFFSFNLAQKHA